ncbi:MAG: helix-turn-helix domain-containing protein [Dissulfurispiraceae bacterium]|jgi:hypothetical protein
MDNEDFSKLRHHLGKTQLQMASLLGCSLKTIASFEQGRRLIPMHIERQALFFLQMTKTPNERDTTCWVIEECPLETREHCPVWEFKAGHICWSINGTLCHGRQQFNWQEKMATCRQCKVFKTMMPDYQSSQPAVSGIEFNRQRSNETLMDPVCRKIGNKREAAIFQQILTSGKRSPSCGFDYDQVLKAVDANQNRKITIAEIGAKASKTKQIENVKNILSKFNELAVEINKTAQELGIGEKEIEELRESTQTREASSTAAN